MSQSMMPPKGSYLYEQMMNALAEPAGRKAHPQLAADKPKGKQRPRHVAGQMNKTESAFAQWLEIEKRAGNITHYAFEEVKFKLAGDKCYYTPDFLMQLASGQITFIDVKGGGPVEDDAIVKIKVAAHQFPMFGWSFVTKTKGGGWVWREFGDTRLAAQ